jgi:Ca2+-binding RTX toxin-like protein
MTPGLTGLLDQVVRGSGRARTLGKGVMTVKSVEGRALDAPIQRPGARELIAVTLTIATAGTLLLPTPAAHAEEIVGTAGDDHIVGTPRGDTIRGLQGDDDVSAWGGRDSVAGGVGNDHLSTGRGPDSVQGGEGDDELSAGDGVDEVYGAAGNDVIRLGSSPERLPWDDLAEGSYGNDVIFGEMGRDEISDGPGRDEVRGGGGADRITVGEGADHVRGGTNGDEFTVRPDGRPDLIACGPGDDTVIWVNRHERRDQMTGCERDRIVSG